MSFIFVLCIVYMFLFNPFTNQISCEVGCYINNPKSKRYPTENSVSVSFLFFWQFQETNRKYFFGSFLQIVGSVFFFFCQFPHLFRSVSSNFGQFTLFPGGLTHFLKPDSFLFCSRILCFHVFSVRFHIFSVRFLISSVHFNIILGPFPHLLCLFFFLPNSTLFCLFPNYFIIQVRFGNFVWQSPPFFFRFFVFCLILQFNSFVPFHIILGSISQFFLQNFPILISCFQNIFCPFPHFF